MLDNCTSSGKFKSCYNKVKRMLSNIIYLHLNATIVCDVQIFCMYVIRTNLSEEIKLKFEQF